MAAVEAASMFVDFFLKDGVTSQLTRVNTGLDATGKKFQSVGSKMTGLGTKMTLAMLPVTAGFAIAIKKAAAFDKAMTNAGAILGKNADEMEELNDQVLALGSKSVAGPQAAAEAFFDIVSGVEDATTHMAILEAAIATAESGQADLGSTTSVLVGLMNAYGLEANQASFASDILTQTVNSGVLTMDELAAALPTVTTLAAKVGISFEEIAGSTALITKSGTSAAKATTQLQAAITSIIKPNQLMKDAIDELGFESGQAALETLGLAGTLFAIGETDVVKNNTLADVLGSTEALNAAMALGNKEAETFLLNFRGIATPAQEAEAEMRVLMGTATDVADAMKQMGIGFEGATERARAIQLADPATQFALLKSNIEGAAIKLGQVLLPVLADLSEDLIPVIDSIVEWIERNPELTKQILGIAAALVIAGPLLAIAGTAFTIIGIGLTGISGIIGLVTTGFGLLLTVITPLLIPLLAVVAIIGAATLALDLLAKALGFEGVADIMKAAINNAIALFGQLETIVDQLWSNFKDWAKTAIDAVIGWITNLITDIGTAIDKTLELIGLGGLINLGGIGFVEETIAQAGGGPAGGRRGGQGRGGGRGGGGGGGIGDLFGGFFGGNATGGPMTRGESSIVGERGPELFVAPNSGRIIPNNQLSSGGGNGRILQVLGNVIVEGVTDIPTLTDEIETEVGSRAQPAF